MSKLTSRKRRKSEKDKAIDIIDHHLFNQLYEMDMLEEESEILYTLAREFIFDKLDGCKRRNLLPLTESYCCELLTEEGITDLIWQTMKDDPAVIYSLRVQAEEEAYERFVNDDLPEIGPLDHAEIIYFNQSAYVHFLGAPKQPSISVTGLEDEYQPDDLGEVDELKRELVFHELGCHQYDSAAGW